MIAGTKVSQLLLLSNKFRLKKRKHDIHRYGGSKHVSHTRVTDRFHTKAALALQEIRIKYRWQAIDQENEAMKKRNSKKRFKPYY
jgi:hypothetical protein